MNCRKVRYYLSTYSDGSLTSDTLREMEVHIRDCKRCEREKFILEEILTAARSLPTKAVPDDFNLKLLNRIYAEQSCPTESYLAGPVIPWLRRPVGWISTVATVAVAALLAIVFISKSNTLPNSPEDGAMYSQNASAKPNAVPAARHVRERVPANTYENIIGVSGSASNYRATNLAQVRGLRLSEDKVESLYVETLKRLGREYIIPEGSMVNASSSYYDIRSPFFRPVYSTNRNLMRNAAATVSY